MADREQTEGKPKALIMFAGRSRAGDLQHQLSDRGWLVCALDILSPTPTNVLDEDVWGHVLKDIEEGGLPCHLVWNAMQHLLALEEEAAGAKAPPGQGARDGPSDGQAPTSGEEAA